MKNKILIIPDVHGRQFWRQAVASGHYSKIIFLGDYVDPYPYEHIDGPTAMQGLVDIIAFRDSHPDQVVLLLGNHDMHYFSLHYHDVCLSDRYDSRQAETLHNLYTDGHRFKLAHEETVGSQKYRSSCRFSHFFMFGHFTYYYFARTHIRSLRHHIHVCANIVPEIKNCHSYT